MGVLVYQVPGAFGMPSVSPFCTKLQAWLRMANVPYELGGPAMTKAPRGKVPFAEVDGVIHTDSQLIVEHLARLHGDPLDGWLTPEQGAIGHMVRRALEEATYWHLASARWRDDDGWATYRPVFEAMVPRGLQTVVTLQLRRNMLGKLKAQGTGLRSIEESHRMGGEDGMALAAILGDKPFVLGDRPAGVDATAFAFVNGILAFRVSSPMREAVASQPALVAYEARVRARWFPELST